MCAIGKGVQLGKALGSAEGPESCGTSGALVSSGIGGSLDLGSGMEPGSAEVSGTEPASTEGSGVKCVGEALNNSVSGT